MSNVGQLSVTQFGHLIKGFKKGKELSSPRSYSTDWVWKAVGFPCIPRASFRPGTGPRVPCRSMAGSNLRKYLRERDKSNKFHRSQEHQSFYRLLYYSLDILKVCV